MQQHPDGGDPASEPASEAPGAEAAPGGSGTAMSTRVEASQPPLDAAPPDRAPHRAPERPAAIEARSDAPALRRTSYLEHDIEVRRVRLDEIDGVDEDITQFLRENDVLVEVSMQSDRWSLPVTRIAVQCLHLPLWYRRGRLVRRARRAGLDSVGLLQASCGLGLLAVLLHSWVEFNLRIPANAMLATFLLGAFLRPLPPHRDKPARESVLE